tara:strand:- start:331 stop:1041 length:711 start_codon:yes stop_codon:yes gene_type:complete
MAGAGLVRLAKLGYDLYKTGKNIGKGIGRATKKSKGRKSKSRNTTQATLSQGITGKVIGGAATTGATVGSGLTYLGTKNKNKESKGDKRRKVKKAIDSKTNVASRMKATERSIGPQLGDKKRKVKKTKSKVTSPPVPKRKPTPSKQKKTTDRIPGPDETEVFVDKGTVTDYKQLPPKVKRQAGGALKPIDPETQPGLAALKKESPETVNKMGYAKKGGRIVTAMTGGQIVSMMYDD